MRLPHIPPRKVRNRRYLAVDVSRRHVRKVRSHWILETGGQGHERKYSPSECLGARKDAVTGNPDPKHISTSYTERANLTMRMSVRRFTRLTNGFSKKLQNHEYMVALYALWYNFVRIHKTLKITPAMAAGIETRLRSMEDVVALIDARSAKITGETLVG